MRVLRQFNTRQTPQSQPMPGRGMVPNSAGGYAFPLDDWARLDRFLVLGTEGGTYYIEEQALTLDNAQAVLRCVKADGARVVTRIVEVSEAGRAPKNDPALFALALAAAHGDPATRRAALDALPRVCRTGTHLFHFAQYVEQFRGWGRGLRRAVAAWYLDQPGDRLAYQAVKYQQRDGWGHRDLLRLAHPKTEDATRNSLFYWMVKGWEGVGAEPHPDPVLRLVWAAERVKRAPNAAEVAGLIRDYRLPREAVPTEWLTRAEVWAALLDDMPMTALIRNLATLTRVGLLTPGSAAARAVTAQLGDAARLRQARVHPIAVLSALKTYSQGRGERGQHTWTPVSQVVDALDAAFYQTFQNVVPTKQRWLLAVDVSGSMDGGTVAGVPGLTPRVAAGAMTLITAAVERRHSVLGFSHKLVPLSISPRQRLDDVVRTMAAVPMGATDCALPMLWALQQRAEVDVFVVYTDAETWAGAVHPVQALEQYRQRMGIPAKLIVVAMTSNGFSLADPNDGGMLDVVGFDAGAPEVMAQFARAA